MSYGPGRIFALDIETDTDGVNGLDPRESRITELAVATADESVVFADDSEAKLLYDANKYIQALQPGLIVTWNGAFFDLPFISDRVRKLRTDQHRTLKGALGFGDIYIDRLRKFAMTLVPQPGLKPKYDYLPGHTTAYSLLWPTDDTPDGLVHSHLDISFAYKQFAAEQGIKHSLKPVARAASIEMIEVDRSKMHELTPQQRHDYAVSDVRGTRELALRLLGAVDTA